MLEFGQLQRLCDRLGIPIVEALREIISILETRRDLLAIGHPIWRGTHLDQNLRWMETLYGSASEARLRFEAMGRYHVRAGNRTEDKSAQYRWRDRRLAETATIACPYCRTPLRRDNVAVDHRVPMALGGNDGSDNWQLTCANCNLGKGALLEDRPILAWHLPRAYRQLVLHGKTSLTLVERFYLLGRSRYCCISESPECCGPLVFVYHRPPVEGGQAVPDNLSVACEYHASRRVRVDTEQS
jgi:hypothetical protein